MPGHASAVGASPGVTFGGDGAAWQGHAQRFVAVPDGSGTVVRELRRAGGATTRSVRIAGRYGIPGVAYDGSVEQVPAESATLVLAQNIGPPLPRRTRFVVLATADLHMIRRITLAGAFAFDALSPDGATLYLTQHASRAHFTRYTVRVYDIPAGRLLPGVIADRTDHEWRMDGLPATRLQTAGGGWAYTLYQGGEDGAFVHALDTRTRTARCIDIPGMTGRDVLSMKLRLADRGRRLVIAAGAKPVAAIDTHTLALVSAPAHVRATAHRQRTAAPPAPSSSSSGSSTDMWAIGVAAALLAVAGLVGVRRRMPQNPADGRRP